MSSQGGGRVGRVKAIYRYPVKSMRGESLDEGLLSWRGFMGDRRFAFIQTEDRSGFPWLTGREYPAMVRYTPSFVAPDDPRKSAVRVRTPDGLDLPLDSPDLVAHIARAFPHPIHLLQLAFNRTFDIAEVSVITTRTLASLSALVDRPLAALRFRPNIVIETPDGAEAYPEDAWEGGTLVFGEGADAPRARVILKDARCKMVDIDPETGVSQPGVLAAIVRAHDTVAGVYGGVERPGMIAVGAPVSLVRL
jgi:MOSC domain-containing protein